MNKGDSETRTAQNVSLTNVRLGGIRDPSGGINFLGWSDRSNVSLADGGGSSSPVVLPPTRSSAVGLHVVRLQAYRRAEGRFRVPFQMPQRSRHGCRPRETDYPGQVIDAA